jgi:hypothetical protein
MTYKDFAKMYSCATVKLRALNAKSHSLTDSGLSYIFELLYAPFGRLSQYLGDLALLSLFIEKRSQRPLSKTTKSISSLHHKVFSFGFKDVSMSSLGDSS